MAKNDKAVIKKITGDTQPFSWGMGRSSSGTSIVSATNAGVVKDVSAPKAWLDLAKSLPNAPQATPTQSAEDKFVEKFKVENGVAHLSLHEFYKLMAIPYNHERLQRNGVTTIDIDDVNFEGSFTFTKKLPDDWSTEPSVNMRTLARKGVNDLIGRETRMSISVRDEVIGILCVNRRAAGLSCHVTEDIAISTAHHGHKGKFSETLILSDLYKQSDTAPFTRQHVKTSPIELINDIYEPSHIGKTLGHIHHPESPAVTPEKRMLVRLNALAKRFNSHTKGMSREDYLQEIFGAAVNGYRILNHRGPTIIGILLPPDDFIPRKW